MIGGEDDADVGPDENEIIYHYEPCKIVYDGVECIALFAVFDSGVNPLCSDCDSVDMIRRRYYGSCGGCDDEFYNSCDW